MKASETPNPAAAELETPSTSALGTPRIQNAMLCNVDVAIVAGTRLLVYGWVLGFTQSMVGARIELNGIVIDLVKDATPVRRPDVARHLALAAGDDEHGFLLLADLPGPFSFVESFNLSVTLSSGESGESVWPVACFDSDAASAIRPHATTLNQLLLRLPKHAARRLIEFGSPVLGLPAGVKEHPSLPFNVRFGIDLCCVLESRLLIVSGWCYDPATELTGVELRIGESTYNILESSTPFDRPDINPETSIPRRRGVTQLAGFNFIQRLSVLDEDTDEVRFTFAVGHATEQITVKLSSPPNEARRELLLLVNKMESESALVFIEQVAAQFENRQESQSLRSFLELMRLGVIDRLPSSIQETNPRYSLHVDQAIPVADKGVFLIGWFNAVETASVHIVCHCGSSKFSVSDNWSRHSRPDVTAHLASVGIQSADHAHGFSCYVPLNCGDAPYHLTAESSAGVRRMRVSVREKPETALQTVRALITSFSSANPELRSLMDRQIGPAVGAAWGARKTPVRAQTFRSYGARRPHPSLSVIVPLYGRHDFAEYQMALFADDPEFQELELIYVVDDPNIQAEFFALCPDLYGMYKVPFLLAYPGVNLGFAGANNFGASAARGDYLLFLNSDVMPRRPNWCADLLQTYKSLANPGMLGAKLLFEDGSVQHAGMEFRQYPGWGDLWINDHPYKGQSPLGLDGVREVDATTAACVLVEASLFEMVGGFSEDYIVGDFEDSDLCMHLNSIGRRNFVALDVELFHLERQSQNRVGDDTWRTNLTLYNCWLHNSRWGDLIDKLVRKHREPALELQEGEVDPPSTSHKDKSAAIFRD